MLFELSPILNAQKFTLVLFIIYTISAIYKQQDIIPAILSKVKSGKMAGIVTILISGVLPVPGRIVLCSSIIRSMSSSKHEDTGIAAYIGTHHYYLWSPIEKSVIIMVAGLSITYIDFVYYMITPLMVYTGFMIYHLNKVNITRIKTAKITNYTSPCIDIMLLVGCLGISLAYTQFVVYIMSLYTMYMYIKHKCNLTIFKDVDYSTVILVFFVILISSIVKQNSEIFTQYVASIESLPIAIFVSFISSYCLGSSSKFAGVCLIATGVFGIEYMCLFYVVDFCGYMLSPCHKCRAITQSTHKIKSCTFRKKLGYMCLTMIIASGLYTWVTV